MITTNNVNDFSKRTKAQIDLILKNNGIYFSSENMGDGRTFYVNDSSLKTRVALKKSGFILCSSNANDKGITFKTY